MTDEQQNNHHRKRQEAVVAMGRRAAIAPSDLSVLLQDAAVLLAEMLETEHASVAELTSNGDRLQQRIELERGTHARAAVTEETSTNRTESLAGYALQVAHPVSTTDLAKEKRFLDRFLRKHGIQSALAVPLKLANRSFGALAACSRNLRQFSDEDTLFAETIAHLVTITLARHQAEQLLGKHRQFTNSVLEALNAVVLVSDPQWRIVRINRACEKITGFSIEDLQGRCLWDLAPVMAEAEAGPLCAGFLRQATGPIELESDLLTKQGQQRRIAWSFRAVLGSNGGIESIIASGIDVTGRHTAAEASAEAAQRDRQILSETAPAAAPRTSAETVPGRAAAGPLPIRRPRDQKSNDNGGRRRRPRQSFPYQQLVAPVLDGKTPGPDDFFSVECNDISSGGLSFFSPVAPPSNTYLLVLGVAPRITYLIAEGTPVSEIAYEDHIEYLVGCSYLSRTQS